MYGNYFGLNDLPFSIAPDPRYLYLSQQHREALAHLQYGLSCNGGFVLLTGEVGTGKTTVCRSLLEQVPEHTDLAFILNPRCTAPELLSAICQELTIPITEGANLKQLTDAINHHLLKAHAQGRQTVLLIDEAQNLSTEVLEQIRLLTNLETNTHKLLQIILLGQPELADKLKQPELRQLSQRITARYHLVPLTFTEMKAYIAHRLSVAGIEAALFQHNSMHRLYRLTGGVPRLINIICDRALLGAYVQRLPRVNLETLNRAATEVLGTTPRHSRWHYTAMVAGLMLLLSTGGWLAYSPWLKNINIKGPVTATTADVVQPLSSVQESQTAFGNVSSAIKPKQPAPPLPTAVIQPSATAPVIAVQGGTIAQPSVWQWPAALTTDISQVMAYRHLFSLWGLDYEPAEYPVVCNFARQHQLECAFQNGDLDTLLRQNHPAVFLLEHPDNGAVFATLTGIDDKEAQLMIGGQLKTITLTELSKNWPGSYVLLWQPPPDYQAPLYPGSRGEAVAWLERHLARWQGRIPRVQNQRYDALMISDIREFQRSKGLAADGIFGPQTGIYFSASLLENPPRLTASEEQSRVLYP